MKYLSICSGIESVGVAWNPLGFEPIGLSEIDPFRSAVLQYHYPEVKNYGDFTQIKKTDLRAQPDVLVGGTPCATFSIAGLREGINTERGNLALEFIKLAQRLQPTWVVWENVPGVLSSNGGRDFASFLGGLAECGYGFAYRVLDTQYIRTQRFPRAIPQMRRRVFVVGHIRDWRRSAEVLFDREVLSWNPPPRRTKGKETSEKPTFRLTRSDQRVQDDIAGTIAARDYKSATDLVSVAGGNTKSNGSGIKDDGSMYTLTASDRHSVARQSKIRRLTPLECERLQGLPDNYTQVPYRGKPKEECPTSKRYEACGRGMSINVMEHIGTRIKEVDSKYEK